MRLTWLIAQNKKKTGIIKDAETQHAIEFVSISIESETNNNFTGAISNENGEFSLNDSNKKVTFNHINYEPLTISLKESFNTILLKPKKFILDEIIISKISTKEYLKNIVENANNKIDKNSLFKTYCRETVKVNDSFTKFSDALVDYYVKKNNGKSTIILNEHRAFSKKNNYSDVEEINSVFKLKEYISNAYNLDALKKIIENDNYKFERKEKKDLNGKSYELVKIIPNIESTELLNTGYIVINSETKDILEFKLHTSKNHLKNAKQTNILVAKVTLKKLLKWSKFSIINKNYVLTYNKKQIEMQIQMGKKVNDNFSFMSDLFVFEYNDYIKSPKKGYKKNTLYKAGTNYKESFWEKYNSFPLTKSQQDFIKNAEEK